MANTKISELSKTVTSIAYEISEGMLNIEEAQDAQFQGAEAMYIISVLLIENGVNMLTADVLEEFDEYVIENGNREIIPEDELFEHIADRIDLDGLRNGVPFISIDLEKAKSDYHEVKFNESTHYVLRADSYHMI